MTNSYLKIAAASLAIATSAGAAVAEVNFGGWTSFTIDHSDGDTDFYFENDVLLSYSNNDFTIGLGTHFEENLLSSSSPIPIEDSGYILLGYKNFTLTAGNIWDAGNIFAEDFFTFSDNTQDGEHIRLDWAINENHHLAISTDLDSGAEVDIAYRGRFTNVGSLPEVIVVAALDMDDDVAGGTDLDDAALLITVPYNNWAYQFIYHNSNLVDNADGGAGDIDYGFAIWRDFDNLTLGAAIEFDENPSVDPDFGIIGQYRLNDNVGFYAQYTVDNDTVVNGSDYEFGISYKFGATQPAGDVRFHRKEYTRWLADF